MKHRYWILVAAGLLAATPVAAASKKDEPAPAPAPAAPVIPTMGAWTLPQVCFLNGQAFSVNAQVCNMNRGTLGNRLLECREGKPGQPATWQVIGNVC